jgi:hypothetical protein
LRRRFGITPKTGNKRLARYAAAGPSVLCDRSQHPRHSAARTSDEFVQRIVELRHESHNSWGWCKLAGYWLTTAVRKKTPQLDFKPFQGCEFRPL